jgi:hypothetical protein
MMRDLASTQNLISIALQNVRYWPKADMTVCAAHVRFRGQSRHCFLRESAIGGKADIGIVDTSSG